MKKLTALSLSLLLAASSAFAMTPKQEAESALQKKVRALRRQRPNFERAVQALREIDLAIAFLRKGQKKKAEEILRKAEREVSKYLKHNPMGFVPLNQRIVVLEFRGNVKDVYTLRDEAVELLKEGRIQDSKPIIADLSDEIDVITTYLPMAMYKSVVHIALNDLKRGKEKEAIKILSAIRDSVAVMKFVIPIPFVKAEALILQARQISKKDKKEASRYLKEAQRQLKLAKALGYAFDYEKTYEFLDKQLTSLEKLLGQKESAKNRRERESLFESILSKLRGLKKKAESQVKQR